MKLQAKTKRLAIVCFTITALSIIAGSVYTGHFGMLLQWVIKLSGE